MSPISDQAMEDVNDGNELDELKMHVGERQKGRSNVTQMEAEYRILQRITCHKPKYDSLFTSFDVEFKRRNRYIAVIPFDYNRV